MVGVWKKILCPFCFKYFKQTDLNYICFNSNCEGVKSEPIEVSRDIKGYLIKVRGKNSGDEFCVCPKCKKSTDRKACPLCHTQLPSKICNGETKIISIVGAANSGKSYYVGAILRKIMDEGLLNQMRFPDVRNVAALWADNERSRDEYVKRFKSKMDSLTVLDPTQYMTDIVRDNPPMLIEIGVERRKLSHYTFSFFDAAGESFHRAGDLAAITPYIAHSEAVIMILDPREIPSVHAAVAAKFPGLPKVAGVKYTDLLQNIMEIIRTEKQIKGDKKIKIPLCIAFSKWDLLTETEGILDPELTCADPGKRMKDGYDEQRIDTISNEIHSLLRSEWNEIGFLGAVEQNFETVKYFCFSAWGSANSGNSTPPAISSYRVEDPLLWVLHRNGVI